MGKGIGLILACSLLLPSAVAPAQAQGKAAMTLTAETPWVVWPQQPEAVRRALADVKADWCKVFGRLPVVLAKPPKSHTGPLVYLGLTGDWPKDLVAKPLTGAESFVLRAAKDAGGRKALVAAGADARGAIYAAYALSEEILGVDPWYYWVDKEPIRRTRIDVAAGLNKRFGPPTFTYRGWFINDEDLLAGFAPDPLGENIISMVMWDRIYETILRLRGNMVVPGTFTFPDERCWALAARRGLALNMHHIQVVGLNTYRWPKGVPFSYTTHPKIMERHWQTCIDTLKDYEVVWTVGYRGKHDRPFWADQKHLPTAKARGELISRVIARQVAMIRKAQPKAAIISNLWVEGAGLYRQGHLKLPDGVIAVWPDGGTGSIRDSGQVKAGQGIYYHTAMVNGWANQLTEIVPAGRIYNQVGRFIRAGATSYFLVNVSDVRPVPLSTDCAMRMVWNAAPYINKTDDQNQDAFLADWSRRQFGPDMAARVAAVYKRYFYIPYMRQRRMGENGLASQLILIDRGAAGLIKAAKPLGKNVLTSCRASLKFSSDGRKLLAALLADAEPLAAKVPAGRKNFYQAHVLTPIQIHLHYLSMMESYCRSLEAYGAGDKAQAIAHAEAALHAGDELLASMAKAEYGKWSGWYRGEMFVGVDSSRDIARKLLALLRGRTPPVVRPRSRYPELYQYQNPFLKNFPLLYPAGR